MRILFISQIIPWPPDAGPKVKTWNVLRYLKESGHQVVLVAFARKEEEASIPFVKEVCEEVHTISLRRSRLRDIFYWLRSELRERPFTIERDDLPEMRQLVQTLLSEGQFDIVHADQIPMAQFLFQGNLPSSLNRVDTRPNLVFDAHNATWTIFDRMSDNVPWLIRPLVRREAKKIRDYEGRLLCSVNHTMAVSEQDRQALLAAARMLNGCQPYRAPGPVSVIPIATDTGKVLPVNHHPGSKKILTLGTLHYPPNADGIRWFMQKVFPLVLSREADTTLIVVGKNPPKDFINAAAKSEGKIQVMGYVPELRPFYEEADVVVVPVRAGGGMRVRILEAFTLGVPVVTTTVGLEGIQAADKEDVMIADSPQDFSDAVCRILCEPKLQKQLAQNSRQVVENRYDWRVVLDQMGQVYGESAE
ncbi:MAG: glycosyltransferase [Chloroflexi bacterium]|nr:glycosyltransferase [Chloroflexota bacterium]